MHFVHIIAGITWPTLHFIRTHTLLSTIGHLDVNHSIIQQHSQPRPDGVTITNIAIALFVSRVITSIYIGGISKRARPTFQFANENEKTMAYKSCHQVENVM